MKTILGLAFVAMLATRASAEHLTTDPYHTSVPNVTGGAQSFTAWCSPGDKATGGGAVCPPGEHLQQSNFTRKLSANQQGWKASCQTADGQEIMPTRVTVMCITQRCAPDSETCYVD